MTLKLNLSRNWNISAIILHAQGVTNFGLTQIFWEHEKRST